MKEKDVRTQDFKSEDSFLKDHYDLKNPEIRVRFNMKTFLETTTFLSRKSRNQNKFAQKQIPAHTHTAKN